jgi:hypothetical protein
VTAAAGHGPRCSRSMERFARRRSEPRGGPLDAASAELAVVDPGRGPRARRSAIAASAELGWWPQPRVFSVSTTASGPPPG